MLRQGFPEDRQEALVQFDGHHLGGPLRQLVGQHPDARPDLQHAPLGGRAAGLRHAGADRGVDEKILPQLFGKLEAVAG